SVQMKPLQQMTLYQVVLVLVAMVCWEAEGGRQRKPFSVMEYIMAGRGHQRCPGNAEPFYVCQQCCEFKCPVAATRRMAWGRQLTGSDTCPDGSFPERRCRQDVETNRRMCEYKCANNCPSGSSPETLCHTDTATNMAVCEVKCTNDRMDPSMSGTDEELLSVLTQSDGLTANSRCPDGDTPNKLCDRNKCRYECSQGTPEHLESILQQFLTTPKPPTLTANSRCPTEGHKPEQFCSGPIGSLQRCEYRCTKTLTANSRCPDGDTPNRLCDGDGCRYQCSQGTPEHLESIIAQFTSTTPKPPALTSNSRCPTDGHRPEYFCSGPIGSLQRCEYRCTKPLTANSRCPDGDTPNILCGADGCRYQCSQGTPEHLESILQQFITTPKPPALTANSRCPTDGHTPNIFCNGPGNCEYKCTKPLMLGQRRALSFGSHNDKYMRPGNIMGSSRDPIRCPGNEHPETICRPCHCEIKCPVEEYENQFQGFY
ncbi:unnamed protein product, partial [Meganyctiphanes norvegica]